MDKEALKPEPPPECQTEAEKTAFAFGWFKAMEAQRLAQPEQEPVAYEPVWDSGPTNKDMEDAMRIKRLSQFVTPPQRTWVGLTDEEFQYCVELKNPESIAEEVEAKLKEKNT